MAREASRSGAPASRDGPGKGWAKPFDNGSLIAEKARARASAPPKPHTEPTTTSAVPSLSTNPCTCAARAERHTDADFLPPLRHRVGRDAAQADRGQQQREQAQHEIDRRT